MKEIKMTKNQKELMIPFWNKEKGEPRKHEPYDGYVYQMENHKSGKLEENKPFEAELEYFEFTRGRSSLNIGWLCKANNTVYYSGMKLLDDALIAKKVNGGTIKGTFWFAKKGTSILLVGEYD